MHDSCVSLSGQEEMKIFTRNEEAKFLKRYQICRLRRHIKTNSAWMVPKRVKYLCVRLREREATPPPLALSRPKLLIISWDDEKVLKEWQRNSKEPAAAAASVVGAYKATLLAQRTATLDSFKGLSWGGKRRWGVHNLSFIWGQISWQWQRGGCDQTHPSYLFPHI